MTLSEYHITSSTHVQNYAQSWSCTLCIEHCFKDLNCKDFSQKQTDTMQQYKGYAARLATYTEKWPKDVPVAVEELAKAGLFFTGNEDRVQCPWCTGILFNWQSGDSGFGEHMRHFPSCSFVVAKFQEYTETQDETIALNQTENTPFIELPCVKAILDLDYSLEDIEKAVDLLIAKGSKGKNDTFIYCTIHCI